MNLDAIQFHNIGGLAYIEMQFRFTIVPVFSNSTGSLLPVSFQQSFFFVFTSPAFLSFTEDLGVTLEKMTLHVCALSRKQSNMERS